MQVKFRGTTRAALGKRNDTNSARAARVERRGRLSLRHLFFVGALVALACSMLAIGSAGASGGPTIGTAAKLVAPSDAASDPGASLGAISCWSAGNCTAVGTYSTSADIASSGDSLMASTESNGTFAPAVSLGLPPNAATTDDYPFYSGISCSSPGNCTAVGSYETTSNGAVAMAVTESDGTFAQPVELTAPSDENTTYPDFSLAAISCTAANDCTAIGSYYNLSDTEEPIVLSETNGSFSESATPAPPANAGTTSDEALYGLSCQSAGNCTFVGAYSTSSSTEAGFVTTESNGTFSPASAISAPANAMTGSNADLAVTNVSCPTAGDCLATGYYYDSSDSIQAVSVAETNGALAQANELGLPANAAADGAQSASLDGVSCPSLGNCTVVGSYLDSAGNDQSMIATEAGGTLGGADEIGLPAGANTTAGAEYSYLAAVSCSSAGNCSTSGGYTDSSNNEQAMTLSTSQVDVAPPPPGVNASSLGTPTNATIVADTATIVTSTNGANSATVTFPPGALPPGTVVSIYPVMTTSTLAGELPLGKTYFVAFVVSWVAPNGTSPNASSPITMVVKDPSIIAGDVFYQAKGSSLALLGKTVAKGTVTIAFTSDPTFVVAATPKLSLSKDTGRFVNESVRIRLHCTTSTSCHGTARLVVMRRVKHGKTTRRVAVGLAKASYSLRAGGEKNVVLHLNRSGMNTFPHPERVRSYRVSMVAMLTGGWRYVHAVHLGS